jgi:hypothetical protein
VGGRGVKDVEERQRLGVGRSRRPGLAQKQVVADSLILVIFAYKFVMSDARKYQW